MSSADDHPSQTAEAVAVSAGGDAETTVEETTAVIDGSHKETEINPGEKNDSDEQIDMQKTEGLFEDTSKPSEGESENNMDSGFVLKDEVGYEEKEDEEDFEEQEDEEGADEEGADEERVEEKGDKENMEGRADEKGFEVKRDEVEVEEKGDGKPVTEVDSGSGEDITGDIQEEENIPTEEEDLVQTENLETKLTENDGDLEVISEAAKETEESQEKVATFNADKPVVNTEAENLDIKEETAKEGKDEDDPKVGCENDKSETDLPKETELEGDVNIPVIEELAGEDLEAKDSDPVQESVKSIEKEMDSSENVEEKTDLPSVEEDKVGREAEEVAGQVPKETEVDSEGSKQMDETWEDQSKESWVDAADGGDDGFQETEEPMETDEFDEVERAVKEERKQSLMLDSEPSTVKEEGSKEDTALSKDGESTSKKEKEEDTAEGKTNNTAVDSVDGVHEEKKEADQGSTDAVSGKEEEEKEEKTDNKDPLTESQEMMMQYDGEDLMETMVSDNSLEDPEKQNQNDTQKEMPEKEEKASDVEEPMEVDSVISKTTVSYSDSKDSKEDVAKEKGDETDVIDMIEERTVSPSLHTEKEEAIKKDEKTEKEDSPSSDVIFVDDAGPKKSEEGEKSKETTPTTEKKRKLGTLGSIVSRLTQSVKEKQSEELSTKPLSDKSIPVISQVKTLSTEPPKEKVGRKQVYKTEEVMNRCSVCVQPFLSLNPIKFNNNVFCSDDCLHEKKGASSDNTLCSYCKKVFKKDSAEGCSIELGMQRKRFCSSNCKSDYQKKVKPCSNCGEDITGTSNAFMAQVGSEGKFMEFCSQNCVESYEKQLKSQPPQTKDSKEKKACSMCRKMTAIKHEVKFRGSYYHMCGTDCFSNFRKKYNLSLRTCNQCGTTCYNEHSPGDDKDGHKVFFCSQKCLEVFQQSRSLSEPCFSCKTMFKQGMLIEGKANNGKIYKFCSQACLQKVAPPSTSDTVPTVTPTSTLKTTSVVPSQGPRMSTQVQTSTPTVQPRIVQPSNSSMASGQNQGTLPCNHCKKLQRPLYHLTMSDSSLRNFCSYPCVIAFQAQFNVPPVTLPQETLLLRCGQCQRGFSHRPQTLDYQGETRLFCSTSCLDDFKRTQSIIAICDCCFEEKILFEETNFLGKARYFCSPGCSLIFKNQFVKRIGLRCAMCDYCSTMCKVATVSVLGGSKKRFCAEECKESYHQWYNKMARCEGCKRMGCELTESFRWRGKVKRVCNEQCLLLFYTQQNVPDMGTQLQSELNPPVKPSENGTGSFPTITNVKSLAGSQETTTHVKHIPMAHKQTQITTNTIFVKPPPPPPVPPPPAPKQVRNKMTLCKPYAVSKAVTCKPITTDTGSQTDLQPVLVPVPVPIFVPVPMQMYTSPVPHPVGIPIPIPTPMFIPVAYNDCDSLMECMENIKNTIPSDPLEADILMMATAIAGKEESSRKPAPQAAIEESPSADDITDLLPLEESEVLDIPNKFLESDSDIAGILADSLETIDTVDLFPEERVTRSSSRVTRNSAQDEGGEGPSTRRARTRGSKRVCVDGDDEEDSAHSPASAKEDVRPDIGPAAYSFFLQQMIKDGEPQNEKLKSNLSLASVDELHYCLCRFVREARQPDGEVYPADTLFLIFLSIQKYLMTNNRKENIFLDPYFQTFANLLHEKIGEHSIIMDPMMGIEAGSTCLDEEFLWDSKQLGAHSPSVLLSTILYFCTKELMLKNVAMHQELAFSRVQRLVRKDSKGKREAYIRFLPSEEQRLKEAESKGKKRPMDIDFSLELHVNAKQPLRCPIKLYEFYLSKCPESVKTSKNIFYLVPERACVPDSPLWYSDKPLPDKMIERYLWRHLIVKDIHEHWEMLRMKKEAGESSEEDD